MNNNEKIRAKLKNLLEIGDKIGLLNADVWIEWDKMTDFLIENGVTILETEED